MRNTLISIFIVGILCLFGCFFDCYRIILPVGLIFLMTGLAVVLFGWKNMFSVREQELINRLEEVELKQKATLPEREIKREEIKKIKEVKKVNLNKKKGRK
jgi:hypothetical protein